MSLTPHGPAFSFLDSFVVTVEGKQGRGRKWLDPSLAFFTDHFPGRPLMPGVLMIECGAQAAGALWALILPGRGPNHFILAQIVQFKIQLSVLPGETIDTDVTLESLFGSLAQFSVTQNVRDREVARGRIVLSHNEGGAP